MQICFCLILKLHPKESSSVISNSHQSGNGLPVQCYRETHVLPAGRLASFLSAPQKCKPLTGGKNESPTGQGTRGRTVRAGVLFQKLGGARDRPWLLLLPAPQPCLLTGKPLPVFLPSGLPPPPASPAEFVTSSPPDPVPQRGVKQLLIFQARLSFHFVSRASFI